MRRNCYPNSQGLTRSLLGVICGWFNSKSIKQRFRDGSTSVKDEQRNGTPRTATDHTSAAIIVTIIEEW